MRTITTLFGSTLCAFALLVAPVQAKDKSTGAPAAACKCTPDTCKCEKKGKCKCAEASCTCEKCKAIRDAKTTAPAKQIFELNNDIQNHCGKCAKKDGDKEKPATCPTCPSKDPAPAKESINVGDNGKCDKKDCDKDKPTTCPDKDSASAKESINLDNHCGKCDKKDDDKEKPAVCPSCPKPETK